MPELRAFLAGGGEMGARIRAHDWSATPLGPIESWPQSLRSALSICLRSSTGTAIFWGPDHLFLYNDVWASFLGADRHPWALGRKAEEVLADIWPALRDQFRLAFEEGEAVSAVDSHLPRQLNGIAFDSWWSYSLVPIAGEDGRLGGVLAQASETTGRVLHRRRDALMLDLAETLRLVGSPRDIVGSALARVAEALRVPRIGYGEVDEQRGTIEVLACALDPDRGKLHDMSGSYPIDRAGEIFHSLLASGGTVRIEEVETDGRMHEAGLTDRYRGLGIVSALVVPAISGARYRAMLFAHDVRPRRWHDAEEALLRSATDLLWREVSRARAEAALRRSEERYRRVFEQANDIFLTASLEQVITDCNPAAAAAMEMEREEIIGRSMHDFLPPDSAEQAREMLRRKLDHGGTTRHELKVVSRSGRVMDWEINSTLTLDEAGVPVGLHAIARDVTERRRAEERQRLLVNELNHRVKNTLALVQGLALQSFRDGRGQAEARGAFQQRLAALASAHDLLTRESWEGATLGQLAREAVAHANGREPRVSVSGPEVLLKPKVAVSLAMAFHELATNAAKYGALSQPGGSVDVGWTAEEGRLAIAWRERGGPEVAEPARRGFGLRMIERALAADLGGRVLTEFARAGLVCRIEAPLAEAAPDGRSR